jgi:hypothetical protein
MTLTTNGKNWLAQHAGIGNCFAGDGITYTDPDGTKTNKRTGDVVNTLEFLHEVANDTFVVIAGTNYAQFKVINDNQDLDLVNDVNWAYANDGGSGSTGTYCYTAPPVLTTITVSPSTVNIASGGSQTFTATSTDQHGDPIGATIAWSSSAPSAGSINPTTGVFTAASIGVNTQTTITATSGSVHGTATATVLRVPPAFASIVITPTTASIGIGATQQLHAVCKDQYDTVLTCPTLTWSSTSPSIATVDQSGLVTGIIEGSTSITADDGGIIISDVSVIIVATPTAEAGFGGFLIAGLAFGAILMGQGTPKTSQGATKSAQVSRSNIGNN